MAALTGMWRRRRHFVARMAEVARSVAPSPAGLMMTTTHASNRWLAAAALALVSAHASGASASDTASCTSAAEEGQRARAAGKLLEARRHFTACSGGTRCPALVQQDCAKWAAEVADATPSIVIDARDPNDHDVGDVTVIVDGTVVATHLDGKALPIDPGPHTILLRRQGHPDVVERIIAKEGVKARPLRVAFSPPSPSPAPERATTESPRASERARATDERARGHTIFPWLVFGAGAAATVAGIVVILAAPDLPPGCDRATQKCTYLVPSVSDTPVHDKQRVPTPEEKADLDARREQAGRSIGEPKLGLQIAIVGALVMTGGIVWHLFEPAGTKKADSKPVRARFRATPWASAGGGGLVAGGTF
jgi:hypothetical protein